MRRFYIDPARISGSAAVLTGPDAVHVRKVLRLKKGDMVAFFDGSGFEYHGRIESFSPGKVEILLCGKHKGRAESFVKIDVAQAMLKGGKMDKLVRFATELGANRWFPFSAGRSVPRPVDLTKRIRRWEKIAIEAAKQCGRVRIPEIGSCLSIEDLIGISTEYDKKIVFWEHANALLSGFVEKEIPQTLLVVIGPEGGFKDSEVDAFVHAGFIAAGLGPRILRADTAAIAACALVQYIWGDMGPG